MVDLTTEFDEPKEIRSQKGYYSLPILDGSIPDFDAVCKLHESTKDKNIYIHAQGHGRTGVVACLLLVMRGEFEDPLSALEHLKVIRPKLNVNSGQFAFLEESTTLNT